jgi:hypothetical protein
MTSVSVHLPNFRLGSFRKPQKSIRENSEDAYYSQGNSKNRLVPALELPCGRDTAEALACLRTRQQEASTSFWKGKKCTKSKAANLKAHASEVKMLVVLAILISFYLALRFY